MRAVLVSQHPILETVFWFHFCAVLVGTNYCAANGRLSIITVISPKTQLKNLLEFFVARNSRISTVNLPTHPLFNKFASFFCTKVSGARIRSKTEGPSSVGLMFIRSFPLNIRGSCSTLFDWIAFLSFLRLSGFSPFRKTSRSFFLKTEFSFITFLIWLSGASITSFSLLFTKSITSSIE